MREAVMRVKVVLLMCAFAFSILPGISPALATPVILTVDSSTSALSGVPLTGTIVGDFDGAAHSLTFGGGSDVSVTAAVGGTGVIPNSTFSSGDTSFFASGSFQTNISSLHLDLTSGTATDGSDASSVTFASTGAGTVSGVLNVDFNTLGILGSAVLNFSGPLTPSPTFQSLAGTGTIGLSDSAGLLLTLPFNVPLIAGDLEVSGGGVLGGLLPPVVSFLDQILAGELALGGRFPGVVVAVGDEAAAVPEPPTAVLVFTSVFLIGFLGHARRRRKAAGRSRP
jgi:hypothetical protein